MVAPTNPPSVNKLFKRSDVSNVRPSSGSTTAKAPSERRTRKRAKNSDWEWSNDDGASLIATSTVPAPIASRLGTTLGKVSGDDKTGGISGTMM